MLAVGFLRTQPSIFSLWNFIYCAWIHLFYSDLTIFTGLSDHSLLMQSLLLSIVWQFLCTYRCGFHVWNFCFWWFCFFDKSSLFPFVWKLWWPLGRGRASIVTFTCQMSATARRLPLGAGNSTQVFAETNWRHRHKLTRVTLVESGTTNWGNMPRYSDVECEHSIGTLG